MKIKVKKIPYQNAMQLPLPKYKKPVRVNMILRVALRIFAIIQLWSTGFQYNAINMDKLKDEPYLILMNHSSFIDIGIASRIFFPKPFSIVVTLDSLVGLCGIKGWAMLRLLGCIPTKKFVSDANLIADMRYSLKEKRNNVLMFPEAGYSFDGRTTTLPRRMGILLKRLDVPVVMITTYGAFARDPLYNELQKRKVKVSAKAECLLTREEIKNSSIDELDSIIDRAFAFDNFAWQQKNNIAIEEPFRADGLHRVLYQCPHCSTEGKMLGSGTLLTCNACGKQYELDIHGYLQAKEGETEFPHIPDWHQWQREQVRKQITDGSYHMETKVKICMLFDHKALYEVGEGILTHNAEGWQLTGCNGELAYTQKALASYSLNADYFWYELGDVICIGNNERLYYCFPEDTEISVTKARLAAEEIYKLRRAQKKTKSNIIAE